MQIKNNTISAIYQAHGLTLQKKNIKMLKKIAKCFADIKTIYIFGALKMMLNY